MVIMRKFYEVDGFEGVGGGDKHISLPDAQAFPGLTKDGYMPGMTKRELISTNIFNGILSSGSTYMINGKRLDAVEELADWSVSAADALINALNK